MTETPEKSDSYKLSSSNNQINFEISENKIMSDFSVPELPSQTKNDSDNNKKLENSKNYSLIHKAVISDNLEELENLLKIGENPDISDKEGITPLYLSVDIENYDAMIILLEFGADCNIQKYDGNTPLHLATEKKNDIYICALLSHGANPNIINKVNLQTPLHIAIINKINEYVLNKFKENNGDIYNIKDKFNKTPFEYSYNDDKYKNLLISIFSEQNKMNNIQKKLLTENSNENNSNLDYHNFISLSRNIQITNEDNNNKELENNTIQDINNCLKKHLIFTSNSKDVSSEEKNKKLIKSGTSKNSNIDKNDKSSQGDTNKNMVNMISDKSSYSSNYTINNIIYKTNHNTKTFNANNPNLTEINNSSQKKINLTTTKKNNLLDDKDKENLNFILSSPNGNNSISQSLNLPNPISSIKSNKSGNKEINNIKTFSSNNGNNSVSSCNKKKEEGISDLNPLDMINQIASSNNSNIFSELQINNKEYENTDSKNMKTEEEFFNEDNNKLTSNEEINMIKENISGNFSSNNNYLDNEEENKENINFANSLDDSLEYSKTKSYIINETPGLLSNKNDNSENLKINNKEESLNIYNNNTDNNKNNNKNIERYKNTTTNKSKTSKKENDFSDSNLGGGDKLSDLSIFSSLLPSNKQSIQHHRQLSYHNNKQSSNNKNKSSNTNVNASNINNYNNSTNKENIEPNSNNSNNAYKEDIIITTKNQEINDKNYENSFKKLDLDKNKNSFPIYTMVTRQKIYRNENILPEIAKEQRTKDSTIEVFKTNERIDDKNDENIFFINNNTNPNNYNEGNTINTGILNNTTHNYNFNTYYSDNNSYKNSKDINNYSLLFKKALKKKYVIKEFSQNNKYSSDITSKNKNNIESNEIIHPQQISNELITKLRDWLISCDLLCYYNLLIKNNIYDIEAYIANLKNNKINISYKDIEDLGIKKPGHIFRFLLKLQMDIGVLDNKICNYIMNKFNDNVLTTVGLSVSEIKYCGMILCPGESDYSRSINYTDIFSFLRNKDLMEFKENFVHNGFDQIEFILIQLFSCFSFNKEILNDYMHIYSENDKIKVIKKLYEEKRTISRELGIDYNEKEVYNIINDQFNEIENNEEFMNNNICNVF